MAKTPPAVGEFYWTGEIVPHGVLNGASCADIQLLLDWQRYFDFFVWPPKRYNELAIMPLE